MFRSIIALDSRDVVSEIEVDGSSFLVIQVMVGRCARAGIVVAAFFLYTNLYTSLAGGGSR